MKYRIEGGFVYQQADGGTGCKYNLGEPVPESLIKNAPLLDRYVKSGKIGVYDEAGMRVMKPSDFIDIPDEDIATMAKTFGWQQLIDLVNASKYSNASLKKLYTAVANNANIVNRETVMATIDSKLKTRESIVKIDSKQEAVDVKKKNTSN
jgi:hypothetical protein